MPCHGNAGNPDLGVVPPETAARRRMFLFASPPLWQAASTISSPGAEFSSPGKAQKSPTGPNT